MDDKNIFEGFRRPEGNFFRLPNEWTDITSEIDNLPELKVIEYIARHTWGFQEYESLKCISTDEFVYGRKRRDGTRMDKGTGLSATGVKEGIARAIKHGYVICEIDDRDKARIKKHYGLKMLVLDSRDTATDSRTETTQGRAATIGVSSDGYRSEKETNGKKKEKESKKGSLPLAHTSIHSSLPSVSLDQCLDAVESFAKAYGDRDPVACRLEAEQLYHASGLDSNAFWDEMFAVKETLGKKSQTMGIFFKRLRKELGREH